MLEELSYQGHPRSLKRQDHKPARVLRRTITIASLAIGCLIPVSLIHIQKAELREKAAQAQQQLQTDPVQGLVLAIEAIGQNRDRLPWATLPEVQFSLLNAVQTARERNRFEQPGKVYTATFTPDAQSIAAAGEEGQIYLWNRQNTQTQVLQGDGQAIASIHFSPDGTAVFGNPASRDGRAQVWNLQNDVSDANDMTDRPPPPPDLLSAAFSSDGRRVVSGSASGKVQLWNRQGEWIANLYPRQSGSITAVAFDGSSIVSGGADGNITLWNTKGDWLGRLWAGASVTSMRVSHSGQRIISQDLNRQQAFIWNPQANQWNQFLLGETATVRSATLSPDNAIIARGTMDGSVQLLPLDAQNHRFLSQSLRGHEGAVNEVTFSSDGKTVASASDDGTVRLWDVWDGMLLTKYHLQEWDENLLEAIALSPDGEALAIRNDQGEIRLRDVEQNVLAQISDSLNQLSERILFSADGQTIAVQGTGKATDKPNQVISLWTNNGQQKGQVLLGSKEQVQTIALSPDGQQVISLSQAGKIQRWDAEGHALGQPTTADPSIHFLEFSPGGQQVIGGSVATNGSDGQTCLWTIQFNELGQPICHSISAQTAVFSPDGNTIAIGSDDGRIYQWEIQTGQVHLTSQRHATSITSIAFSSDGTRMVSGSSDGIIRLATGAGNSIGQPLVGHQAAIQSLAFEEEDTIVSLGRDGEVRVWQGSWEGWLQTACNRLQNHPVFRTPATSEAQRAKTTCQRYVWSAASENPTQANTTVTEAAQPTSTASIAQETRLVVKLGDRRVYVYQGDTVQASYPIAIGKEGWETPTGTFRVFEMLQNPAWTHPITRERMAPGGENPLGTRWIGFWSDNYNKIGFHGTPTRDSVGQAISHGCLRMYDEDVRALYEQIELGTLVVVEP